jgi:hypothetical protein
MSHDLLKLEKKPVAKALIIRATSGPKVIKSISSGPISMLGSGPLDMLKDVLSGGMLGGSMPMPMPPISMSMGMGMKPKSMDPEYNDTDMVKSTLKSIIAVAQKLEEMHCCCNPMPSWAEAKIYNAQKDILTVLGALMGRELE